MPKPKSAKASKYQPHPMLGQEEKDKERLVAATGKSFDAWVELARKKGPKTQQACRKWLQEEHAHGSRYAWWIASSALAEGTPDYTSPAALVDALYCGDKAALRPIQEAIVDVALAFGDDVIPTSCKTMVPIYRKHVFIETRPVDGAVEAQMAIGDVPAKGRLLASGGRQPGDRLTHRVILRSVKDVDAEFRGWLKTAYENGAAVMKRAQTAETPPDLAKALKAAPAKARATWDDSTPAMQRDWILWIESAKQAETRTKRLGTTIEKLSAGKKRAY